MCGRYTLFTPEQVIEIRNIVKEAERRVAERNSRNVRARLATHEVRPTNLAPILIPETGRFGSYPAFWGFTRERTAENRQREQDGKKPLKPQPVFNARAETAGNSYFWRYALAERRCIVPTAGFYEWKHEIPKAPGERAKDKGVEYFFTLPGAPVTYIAGIWQNEADPDTGETWPHFSMLTTAPSESIVDVHDRMPVVLLPDELDEWMGGDYQKLFDRKGVKLKKSAA